ncbi:lysophospholipid acyltransferase family protein [Psychroserpens sp.]|uniref:lysophospholipid acyltransferase family protein n=1 Tax=Psychroserpens sp. TaxID=2020870 RepID=UPI001B228143|nr:lysophospholipid acyltransferase family protein [Psychroserpens sp.]MBO6605438.1 1-acyl-sn-glycerol-3-phosphate acyltransferase [Psychroserpens sp.]MBO6630076.1 1-acyl-sn-glycerol-3-phosphate acyltransferase [Psychroserpens sp.]MBO6653753.1 1-acyl-sn-glycerol-3-phosphate acyltransferase [Psychroserpens sp.]MBO6682074.1 1-acyl-sn-glycerol-3-phosphate acyltransferase [Psychroserpens sp.]MBO6748812.1 1-acyl-sn-glycerol-3-phosphate acyltransferase [Psychroserpens sp.]
MIVFKYIFWVLYRIWFYVLVALPIILLLPILVVSILKESWYPYFFKLARFWAKFILTGMGFNVKIEREQLPDPDKSYMFVANHTSMTDIMLMLVAIKNPFVFVGKKELARIPLFGFFYKRTSILVDRGSSKSRQAVFIRAQRRLRQGMSICIFPEGGVPDESIALDEFKDGAFRMAINHKIPIVPLTFADNKKRFSYTFFSGGPGKMRVKIHQFIDTSSLNIENTKETNHKVHNLILNQLEVFHS